MVVLTLSWPSGLLAAVLTGMGLISMARSSRSTQAAIRDRDEAWQAQATVAEQYQSWKDQYSALEGKLVGTRAIMVLGLGFGYYIISALLRANRRLHENYRTARDRMMEQVTAHLQAVEHNHQTALREARAAVEAYAATGHRFPPPLELPTCEEGEAPDFPLWAVCPISMEVMTEPVCTPSGVTYERQSLCRWIEQAGTDPSTKEPLSVQHLYPNLHARNRIQEYVEMMTPNLPASTPSSIVSTQST